VRAHHSKSNKTESRSASTSASRLKSWYMLISIRNSSEHL
jgi:hypothetical protein